MTRRALLAAALAVVALMTTPPFGGTGAQEPERGGTLNAIINPEPPLLVLGLNQQQPTQVVAGKIYQGLLRYDFDLTPLPSLAKSWEVSEDGLTYTFKLEEDVRWHDGEPFTAEDVVFTTRDFLPEVHPRARQAFERCESIEALDEHTVRFRLKEPFEPFLYAFLPAGAPMMPKHLYEGTDFRANPANDKPIGTGPFKFGEWVKGSYIHLVRNDDYWKEGRPYLDEIYYRVIPDAASRALALETGEVDLSQGNDVESFDVPRLQELPHLAMDTRGYETVAPISWIEINHRIEPLGDKRFRQAMMHAIDRQFIIDNIWFGLGRVAHGPISTATRYHDPEAIKRYDYDPQKAVALLDEMGLEPDGDGVRARIRLMVLPYGEVWVRQAEFVRQQLGEVGIEVTLESNDPGGWVQRIGNWDYETSFDYVSQFMDPALGVARTYISSNIRQGVPFTNTMGYVNERVDELFALAPTRTDPAEAQKMYSELQAILTEDVPVVWLTELEFPNFVNTRVKNAIIDANGPASEFDEAYIED
ncbi:MAG TPA: ABC transporter substrate-binding protein [Geminicoccaceae bacterium]|nr:ABC transporter substrate-binding protein [Geminicoccaceae bacterium]